VRNDTREIVVAALMAVVLSLAMLCIGCNISTQVRPWFAKPPAEQPAVQPAPAPPPPPKDDWAPPWFHRPKPSREAR